MFDGRATQVATHFILDTMVQQARQSHACFVVLGEQRIAKAIKNTFPPNVLCALCCFPRQRAASDRPCFIDLDLLFRPRRHATPSTNTHDDNDTDVPILRIHRNGAQPLYDTHPRAHPPKNSMLVIEVGRRGEGDEELGALGAMSVGCWYRGWHSGARGHTIGVGT